jgi:hypothetical protein
VGQVANLRAVANRAPRFLFTDHERVKNPLQVGILPHNYVLLS